jgi:hypothetical protein
LLSTKQCKNRAHSNLWLANADNLSNRFDSAKEEERNEKRTKLFKLKVTNELRQQSESQSKSKGKTKSAFGGGNLRRTISSFSLVAV